MDVPFGLFEKYVLHKHINAYTHTQKKMQKIYQLYFSLGDGITSDIFYFLLITIFWIFFKKHIQIARKKVLSKPQKLPILRRKLRQKFTDFPQLD